MFFRDILSMMVWKDIEWISVLVQTSVATDILSLLFKKYLDCRSFTGNINYFLNFQYFFCRYVPPGKRNQFNPQRNRHVPPNTNMPVRMPVHQPPPQPTAPRLAAQHSREEVKINGNGRFIGELKKKELLQTKWHSIRR